jgi:hypothetical protein
VKVVCGWGAQQRQNAHPGGSRPLEVGSEGVETFEIVADSARATDHQHPMAGEEIPAEGPGCTVRFVFGRSHGVRVDVGRDSGVPAQNVPLKPMVESRTLLIWLRRTAHDGGVGEGEGAENITHLGHAQAEIGANRAGKDADAGAIDGGDHRLREAEPDYAIPCP